MMKRKLLAALICILFVFSVVGCKSTTKSNMDFSDKKKSSKSTVTKDDESMDWRYHRVNK